MKKRVKGAASNKIHAGAMGARPLSLPGKTKTGKTFFYREEREGRETGERERR